VTAKCFVAISLGILLSSSVLAQKPAPPDLSGTWVLNPAKSKLPKRTATYSETVVIVQSGQIVQFSFTFNGQHGGGKYIADGETHFEQVILGRKLASKASWENSTLETERLVFSEANGRVLVDRKEEWTLSADGRTLTRVSRDPKTVSVYDKQSAQ
jgi:hypothetical protein